MEELSQWVGLMLHPEGPLSGQLNIELTQKANVTQHKGYRIELTTKSSSILSTCPFWRDRGS